MAKTLDFSVLTLKDALDLAILIEDEAEQRYTEFAEQLGRRYPGDASDVFEMMAVNEAKHAQQLSAKRAQLFGSAPRDVTAALIDDVEAPEYDKPRAFMSPREALEVSLASEIKAFDFYDRALSDVRDPEVRALFLELREEEAEHRALLERRLVATPPAPPADAEDMDDIPQL